LAASIVVLDNKVMKNNVTTVARTPKRSDRGKRNNERATSTKPTAASAG
jgi:hypothetical protein